MQHVITDHIDVWTGAYTAKSSAGRGSSSKLNLHGIKKLRELILELAVRGKLVPQDPNDEPASVLLERIAVEKARLIAEGTIKKQKPLLPITDDEKPFELPTGWKWARLQDIGRDWGQKTPDSQFTYIDVGAINKELGYIDEPSVLEAGSAPSRARKLVQKGTVIYSTVRPYLLNIAVIDQTFSPEPIASTAFAIIHPLCGMLASYVYRYLRSPSFVAYVEGCQTGIAYPAINDKQFFSGVLPVPPLAEQHRIVTKVNELMALCDQLEQQQTDAITAHATLVETLLTTLTNSTTAIETTENWNRIAEHFDTLFTTEHSIDQLKQTILQLAVMGKLVVQNPADEPASVLLSRIADEKARLVKEGKIKKQKPLPPINDDEKQFELPSGWEWCRFGEMVSEVATGPFGSMIHKSDYTQGGVPLINPSHMLNGRIVEDFSIAVTPDKAEKLQSYILTVGDLVMARRGEMGRCALVTEREQGWLCGTGSFILKFINEISRDYLLLLFKTAWVRAYLGGNSVGTTMVNLNHSILNKMPCLLPSISEQYRIVTKVNELTILCDQLKTRIQQTQQTNLHLADAVVEQALG